MLSPLLGKSLSELQTLAVEMGLPRFVGKQLCEWLYHHRVRSFDEMTNLSKQARQRLSEQFVIGTEEPLHQAISSDGTRKYLFRVDTDSQRVECVYLPEDHRATLCVSTQAGCKMGCRFCMTGTLGFHGNLTAADMLRQILFFPTETTTQEGIRPLTNLVFMGEGEPMDNIDNLLRVIEVLTAEWGLGWSPRRITVSTAGILRGQPTALQRFIEETDCHLAVSLHNPYSNERAQIMPVEKLTPITDVLDLLRNYDWSGQRRLSFEYICWAGLNDDIPHAKQLRSLLQGLQCRVNLIRFHSIETTTQGRERIEFPSSDEQRMIVFRDYLSEHGITTTIRRSRGEDILAACGMLIAQQ